MDYKVEREGVVGGNVGSPTMYSDEEIEKYLNILHNYKLQKEKSLGNNINYNICQGCLDPKFFIEYSGQYMCDECGKLHGYILGKFDVNDFNRLHYQKKSIYHRKYYFDKKIKNISKLIKLTDEEKSELYDKLLILDNTNMKIINKKHFRKRMININYVIKKILEEMGCKKYKNIKIKISSQILNKYNDWWNEYKELLK